MKIAKLSMYLAIIAVVSILIGVAFFAAGGDYNIQQQGINVNQSESISISGINKIQLEESSAQIRILHGASGELTAKLTGTTSEELADAPKLTVSSEGDTIIIGIQKNRQFRPFYLEDLKLEVYVPAEYKNNFEVSASSSSVSFDEISAKNISCSTSSGSIRMNNVAASNLKLRSSSGAILSNNTKADLIDILTSSGRISFLGIVNGSTALQSSSGSIYFSAEQLLGNTQAKTSSGVVHLELPENSDFELIYETSSGSYHNEFAMVSSDHRARDFTGTHGLGTYKIQVDTSSGSLNIDKRK